MLKKQTSKKKFVFKLFICLMFLALTHRTAGIICSDKDSSTYEIKSKSFSYFGSSDSNIYKTKFGTVSNDIYFAGVTTQSGVLKTVIQRSTSDLSLIKYTKLIEEGMGGTAFEVDSQEDYTYHVKTNGTMIRMVQCNATDGTLTNSYGTHIAKLTKYDSTIIEHQGGNLYANLMNGTSGVLCSFNITASPWTLECTEMIGFTHFTSVLLIDSQRIFYEAYISTGVSNRGYNFLLIDFDANTVEWSWKMNCTEALCTPSLGHSIFSDDQTFMWVGFTMEFTTGQFGLLAINVDDGSLHNNIKYTLDVSTVSLFASMKLFDSKLYATFTPNVCILGIYYIDQNNWSVYDLDFYPLSLNVNFQDNQLMLAGSVGIYTFQSIFTYESIPFHPNIQPSSFEIVEMPSTGYEYFNDPVSIGVLVSGTMSTISPSLSYSAGIEDSSTLVDFESSTYFQLDTYENYDLLENSNVTLHLELTCTPSGTTAISSILSDYEGSILPSWVSLDNSTGELFVQTQDVDASTNYTFSVLTNVDNISRDFYKPVYLGVNPCTIDQCQQCNSTQASQCLHCVVGYSVVSGVCQEDIVEQPVEDEELVKTVTTTTLGSLVASTGMIIVSASISASSLIGAWSLFNQIQMLILILLMHANIPKAISDFLSGMDFSMFSFNSLLSGDGNQLSKFLSWIGGEQSSEDLKDTGVEYSSSISNNFSMLLIMLVTLILIATLYALIKWMDSKRDSYPKTFKFFKYTQRFLIYSTMLRLFLQSNQFFLLTSMSEVGEWEYSEARKVISSLFAMALAILNTAAILVTLNCWYKARKSIAWTSKEFEKHLFEGLLMKSSARLYPMLLLLRRYILILFLTQLVCYNSDMMPEILVCCVCIITIPYAVAISLIRPFVKLRDNIVEIVNEIYFIVFVCLLFYYNTTGRWAKNAGKETMETVYMYLIMLNNLTSLLIVFVDFTILIVRKIAHWCKRSSKVMTKEKQAIKEPHSSNEPNQTELQMNTFYPKREKIEQRQT